MNREIKFRAWDVESKKFIKQSGRETQLDYESNFLIKPCIYELQQYTGLHDKNGREIYEGDIIECSGHNDLCVVYFDVTTASYIALPWWMNYESWSRDTESDPEEYLLWDNITIKIIGNIHENPELLK